jgi:hypothetical protein
MCISDHNVICLTIHSSFCPSTCLLFHLPIYLSTHLSICPFTCLSIHINIHTYTYMHSYIQICIHTCIYTHIHLLVHPSIHLSLHTSTYLSVYLSSVIYASIHQFVHSFLYSAGLAEFWEHTWRQALEDIRDCDTVGSLSSTWLPEEGGCHIQCPWLMVYPALASQCTPYFLYHTASQLSCLTCHYKLHDEHTHTHTHTY